MEKGVLLLVICLAIYVWSAHIESETVWVKDVTTSLQKDKRKLSDTILPDNLTFELRSGSRSLTLDLKRNHAINPNANVFFVSKLNDGRSHLEKALTSEEKELAYYQDKRNGAFMTVKCLRRSSGGCDRVINGNILIKERNYDLHPAKTGTTSRDLFDVPDLGTRYILRAQINIPRESSVSHEDLTTDKGKQVDESVTFVSRNGSSLHNRGNGKRFYFVETAVLLDSTIWNFYFSLMTLTSNALPQLGDVARKIREVYSHIMNGVNMRYSTIKDPAIEIIVTLHNFYIFRTMKDYGHEASFVEIIDGKTKIEIGKYLCHQAKWTKDNAISSDHVMLFTKYDMYEINGGFDAPGYAYVGFVCDHQFKTSLIQSRDYYLTVSTAAHELAHNLGSHHDGQGNAIACRAEDYFLMTPLDPMFNKTQRYSRNPWIFSTCSVKAFKHELQNKMCLDNVGTTYNLVEWNEFTKVLPGQAYSLNQQCELYNGHGSFFCGKQTPDICLFMKCADPFTKDCLPVDFSAFRGTGCGKNMWCKEGLCVSKTSK